MRLQAIRRKVDVADAVVADKEVDDLRQFFPQRRLTAAEPEIRERRRIVRQLDDLIPRQIALLIEFVPVETRLTRRVAMRRDKENNRVQLSFPGEPPNT